MNELQIFNKEEFGQIRMVEIDNKPYFVAKDIALCLGYKDTTNAIKQHCRWVVKHHLGVVTGKKKDGTDAIQNVEMNIIPEGDMYRLITNSELSSAEKFEVWVFDEVLPSIRKTGSYNSNESQLNVDELNKCMKLIEPALTKVGVTTMQKFGIYKEVLSQSGINIPVDFIESENVEPAAYNNYSFNRNIDLVKRFIDESCIIDKNSMVPSADLYNSFLSWCEINNEEPISQTMFGRKLSELGINKGRSSFMRFWKGIRF